MQKELKQDFTRRLAQCNRGEMIVIIYDIYFAYAEDAKTAYADKDHEAYREAVRKAQKVLTELIHSLNFSYELSKNLYQLYVYSRNSLSRALYENRLDGLLDAERVMRRLYTSFEEVARLDKSAPLMRNAQQVYAGMTYGRGSLNENLSEADTNRGFLA
jgi:flagellar protein FliS